jgi:hypothetical protein
MWLLTDTHNSSSKDWERESCTIDETCSRSNQRRFPDMGSGDAIKAHRILDTSTESHNYTEHNKPAQYSVHTRPAAKELKQQTAGTKE